MRNQTLRTLVGLIVVMPLLFGQANVSAPVGNVSQAASPIPEEARKHFVIGATLFKDAKTADDFSQVVSEFKQAADLAPQWQEARYNMALAREAAGDYAGAMADLKVYQKFTLSESEARKAQDKIYVLEAKADVAARKRAADQQVANGEQVKAQQLVQAQRLMEIFRGNWDAYECVVGKMSRASIDRGCTGAEMKNDNWYDHGRRRQFEIENDGTVKLGGFWGCIGNAYAIPQGPSLTHIRWELREEGHPAVQIWGSISASGNQFTVGCNRSPSASDAAPYVYLMWQRTP